MRECAERELHERMYRVYVTDGLKVIGGLDRRYADMVRRSSMPVESRSAEDIITHVKDRIKELTKGGDPDGADESI